MNGKGAGLYICMYSGGFAPTFGKRDLLSVHVCTKFESNLLKPKWPGHHPVQSTIGVFVLAFSIFLLILCAQIYIQ